jgi:hypothetical protein
MPYLILYISVPNTLPNVKDSQFIAANPLSGAGPLNNPPWIETR